MNYSCHSDILKFMYERGYIDNITHQEQLDLLLMNENKPFSFYIGFDCTAESLHIGHLMHLRIIQSLIKFNMKAIILLGGATSSIGDPSGKNSTRKMLDDDSKTNNLIAIEKQIRGFFPNNKSVFIVNNNDWFQSINFCDFIKNFGRFFSVNKMLSLETFKNRIENQSNLSFMEFSYILMQSYDFIHLHNTYNCNIQIGGSDQWANITYGIELAKKINSEDNNTKSLFGITTPLLLNSDGKKMGKTEKGAIWLDQNKLSVNEFWQFFRNTSDSDLRNMMIKLTDLEIDQIDYLIANENINNVKKILATEVTTFCHGADLAKKAQDMAELIFSKSDNKVEARSIEIENGNCVLVNEDIRIIDLVVNLGLSKSKKNAKELIRQNAIRVEDIIVKDCSDSILSIKALLNNRTVCRVYAGRKNVALIKITI